MADTVLGSDVDVDVGGGGGDAREHGVHVRGGGIAHHHRAGLGVDRLDLADTVVLFHGGRVLVLADSVGRVISNRSDRGKAGLSAVAPGLPVDVVAGLGVADQHAGRDHPVDVLGCLGVDGAIVGINRRVEVDLGLRDVEEAPRLALGPLARLGARKHVVRGRQDFGCPSRRGRRARKGLMSVNGLLRSQRVGAIRLVGLALGIRIPPRRTTAVANRSPPPRLILSRTGA